MRDLLQNFRLDSADASARRAQTSADFNKYHLEALQEKVDSLVVLSVAAIELLGEAGISDQRIAEKLEEIDLRDGKADNKLGAPKVCSDCGHKISPKRKFCFYCGAKVDLIGR